MKGMIVRDLAISVSNYRSTKDLPSFCAEQGVVGIADVDTRALTRVVRDYGCLNGVISTDASKTVEELAAMAKAFDISATGAGPRRSPIRGRALRQPRRALPAATSRRPPPRRRLHLASDDEGALRVHGAHAGRVGVRRGRPRQRRHAAAPHRGLRLRDQAQHPPPPRLVQLPRDRRAGQLPCREGPGHEPRRGLLQQRPRRPIDRALRRRELQADPREEALVRPELGWYHPGVTLALYGPTAGVTGAAPASRCSFGICMGHQVMGQALGSKTFKLKFGHHGGNHPIRFKPTGRTEISAQNHNFAVDPALLPKDVSVTHINLNDGTCAGLMSAARKCLSIQYHPEASPGPHDADVCFDMFIELVRAEKQGQESASMRQLAASL